MRTWRGTCRAAFTAEQFRRYAEGMEFGRWRPRYVVLHNTAGSLASWHRQDPRAYLDDMAHEYHHDHHWSAGPHLFVADDLVWLMTPLITPGVHARSFNPYSWGVEVVGAYEQEALSAALLRNLVSVLATLHERAGLDPHTMRLHRWEPATKKEGKPCPGRNLASHYQYIVGEVVRELEHRRAEREGDSFVPRSLSRLFRPRS